MKKCLLRAVSASLLAAQCLTAQAARGEPLTLLVFDRPPYYRLENSRPAGGFLLILTQSVLHRAGVDYVLREMPPGRILATFEFQDVNACAIGWLDIPGRQHFARFSSPLYLNRSLGAVISAYRAESAAKELRLTQLLEKNWNWGLRLGFSYGPAIDAAFAGLPEDRVTRFSDSAIMLRLLAKGRLDAVLIEPEELAWLLGQEPALAEDLSFLRLTDAPPPATRHLMCDATVSPAVMARINAAIDELVGRGAGQARLAVAQRH